MIIWAAVATAAAIISVFILLIYRRQVKNTCRQLEFLKENKTNLRLTLNVPFKEFEKLVDNINDILDLSREIEKNTHQNEESLKETITNLSHDIRTPLTSMDGYFQLLAKSETEEEQRHYLEVIQSRISSLKDMLEELFTYTKLQNESYEMEIETVDFGKCVFDTVFSFYDDFKKKGLEPELDLYEGNMPVEGNQEAIRRMLQNIVKNALVHGNRSIKMKLYHEEGDTIFICANYLENQNDIEIEQVFSRFYKADSARSNNSTGLGLSIAKELVERMNGNITAGVEDNLFIIKIKFQSAPLQRNISRM